MYNRLIKNDIKKSKLITATITGFILLAALLTSLAAILSINLLSAIDNMMITAKTPHFMQMHTGDIDTIQMEAFVQSRDEIQEFQVLEFLNIDGSEIIIDGTSLSGSIQDNGFSAQSQQFDFLLNLDGEIIVPKDGEVYVPVYYMQEHNVQIGDKIQIYGVSFTVAGFLRDSQMNSAMISSKRFLLSDDDLKKIKPFGNLEYLIEFRLQDSSSFSEIEAAYLDAGREANGPPAVTYPLFKMANGITDGIMIAVLVLVSILVIIVTFLCIRFTLLAKIEDEYREIGILKAIGLRVSSIKRIYLAKYGAIGAIACICGFLLSLLLQIPLMKNIRMYMGESSNTFLGIAVGMLGAFSIFVIMLLYVNGVLNRFRKISTAEAIRFGAPQEKSKGVRSFQLTQNSWIPTPIFLGIKDILSRKKLYITMLLVLVISSFIVIVPQNIYNTISSRNFMAYMGIGTCDMRIDVQQVNDIQKKTNEITEVLEQDNSISNFAVLTSYMFEMPMDDGSNQRLKVELGNHTAFPIEYSRGRAPQTEGEIAISILNADDLEKSVGDELLLLIDGKERTLVISGIYSDITNGGKTAKAIFDTDNADILWTILPISFHDNFITEQKVSDYMNEFTFAKVSNIDEYVNQTFGQTIESIRKASFASIIVAVLLIVLVTALFFKMLIVKDRYSIAVLKSLGLKNANICKQYISQSLLILIIGAAIGTILSNTVGELIGTVMISSFGANSFHFAANPLFTYLFAPLLMAGCVLVATFIGISDIRFIKIAEHIKE